MASRKPSKAAKPARSNSKDVELSDAVLEWVSAGRADADAHGCPACPHNGITGFGGGSHILVDGTIFQNGIQVGKLKL